MHTLDTPRCYKDFYTDAPPLHRSAVLATLQILAWLFFHPAAWRSHVARVDPGLRPDFCISQLSMAQLRNPALRRLLLLGHGMGPLLVTVPLSVELWLLHTPAKAFLVRVVSCVAFGVIGGLINGSGTVTAVGMATGMIAGLLGTCALGVAAWRLGPLHSTVTGGVEAVVADYLRGGVAGTAAMIVALGVAGGVVFVAEGGVEVGVAPTRSPGRGPYSGGLLIGLFVGGFFFAAAVLSALTLRFQLGVTVTGFITGAAVARAMSLSSWRSLLFGLSCGLANYVGVRYVVPSMRDVVPIGCIIGALFSGWFSVPYLVGKRVGGTWAGAVAGALGLSGGWVLVMSSGSSLYLAFGPSLVVSLLFLLFGMVLGLTHVFWRPLLLYPFEEAWNLILFQLDRSRAAADRRPSWLRWHAVFWDELQRFAFYGLDEHLLLVLQRNPEEGRAALERLTHGNQRWVVQAVGIELGAQLLESCADAEAIGKVHPQVGAGELEGPVSALLRSFSRISQDIGAALAQTSTHNRRLGLSLVEQRLEGLLAELGRSSEPYAVRFMPIARGWQRIVQSSVASLLEAEELHQEIDNPYVIGVPLTLEQELFVGRADVSARIEQLLLDRRRPPLLLYGQRRMGKTSLLNNLGRLLPSTIVPLFVDLQGPATAATGHAGFLYNLARGMIDSAQRQRNLRLPALSREALTQDPFTRFDEWLDEIEQTLGTGTALLALDEFEALDRAIEEGRFSASAILGMLRHLGQHRPRWKILLASSHSAEELNRWSSYLINVQIVQVGYLREAEARQLIEQPVPGALLRYEPAATDQILRLTHGHPFLVQLLCAEIVVLKNEQEPAARRLATPADVATAVPAALSHGSFFFADIERNQVDAGGRELLRFIAAADGEIVPQEVLAERFGAELDALLLQLRRRDLIEPAQGGQRFQVELIRRWFADGGGAARRTGTGT